MHSLFKRGKSLQDAQRMHYRALKITVWNYYLRITPDNCQLLRIPRTSGCRSTDFSNWLKTRLAKKPSQLLLQNYYFYWSRYCIIIPARMKGDSRKQAGQVNCDLGEWTLFKGNFFFPKKEWPISPNYKSCWAVTVCIPLKCASAVFRL